MRVVCEERGDEAGLVVRPVVGSGYYVTSVALMGLGVGLWAAVWRVHPLSSIQVAILGPVWVLAVVQTLLLPRCRIDVGPDTVQMVHPILTRRFATCEIRDVDVRRSWTNAWWNNGLAFRLKSGRLFVAYWTLYGAVRRRAQAERVQPVAEQLRTYIRDVCAPPTVV